MATTPTKLNILNSALRKVGSYHLDANDTTSTTYQIVHQAYLDSILEVFSENTFNYNTVKLSQAAYNQNSPDTTNKYQYFYNLPQNFNYLLYIQNKEQTEYITEFEIYGTVLYTNEKEICMYYTKIPDFSATADSLPPYLNRLIVLHIAQAISIELSGSENRHEILHAQYIKALRRARVIEARQGPGLHLIDENTSRFIATHNKYGSVY